MTPLLSEKQLDIIRSWLGTGSINIFGLPFAGKDTHGNELVSIFNAPALIGGGDIMRNSTISAEAKRIIDAGGLSPSDEYMRTVTPYLQSEAFAGKPLILSSVGRWIGEEQGVLKATEASGHPTRAVIYLNIDEATLFKRWEVSQTLGDRGDRADDAEHALRTRINEFNEKTLPVIEVYRSMDLLIEVNSDADRQEILETILSRLLQLATV